MSSHETNGAGHPDESRDTTTYSTRSKRRLEHSSASQPLSATVGPPAKKVRQSFTSSNSQNALPDVEVNYPDGPSGSSGSSNPQVNSPNDQTNSPEIDGNSSDAQTVSLDNEVDTADAQINSPAVQANLSDAQTGSNTQADSAQDVIPALRLDPPSDSEQNDSIPSQRGKPSIRGGRGRGRGRRGGRGRGGAALGGRGGPSVIFVPGIGRGKGGYRVKKSDNARIQSLYHRRQILKQQFRQIGAFQRTALEALADKSTELLKTGLEAHEKQPEFETVIQGLDQKYQERLDQLDRLCEQEKEYLERQRAMKDDYALQQFRNTFDDLKDRHISLIKEEALNLKFEFDAEKVAENNDTASNHSEEKSHLPRICEFDEPEDWVHPGDAWINGGLSSHRLAQTIKNQKAAKGGVGRGGRGKKSLATTVGTRNVRPRGSALYQPASQMEVATPLGEASSAPTPVDGSDKEPDEETSKESEPELAPADEYDVRIPRRAIPRNGDIPNNRIAVPATVEFEEHEIGLRQHHFKAKGQVGYLGLDADPTPKSFHLDQTANNYNSTCNKPEDMDQNLIERHKLHPMGIAIKGCVNPTFGPPTDWSKPLSPTMPKTFVSRSDPSRFPTQYDTSRSARIISAERRWDQLEARERMGSAMDVVDPKAPRQITRAPTPETSDLKEPRATGIDDLLSAADKVQSMATTSPFTSSQSAPTTLPPSSVAPFPSPNYAYAPSPVVPSPPVHSAYATSPLAHPPPAPPLFAASPFASYPFGASSSIHVGSRQRITRGYDAVRDIGHPSQLNLSNQFYSTMSGSQLAHLADAAELNRSMPPPPAFNIPRPFVSFGPPPLPHGMQQNMAPPPPPPPPSQYPSPFTVPGTNRHREIRPAPPQNRGPPPPPPSSRWYPGS